MKIINDILSDDSAGIRRLIIGCGKTNMGRHWDHIDSVRMPHITHVFNLELCSHQELPYQDDLFDVIYAAHTLEHITNILPLMQELYRIAKPGCKFIITVPHGACDIADEDPTHVRRFFPNSFLYFGQSAYQRASYGYTGDWKIERLINVVNPALIPTYAKDNLEKFLMCSRNIAEEMTALLVAQKPARTEFTDLDVAPMLYVERVLNDSAD